MMRETSYAEPGGTALELPWLQSYSDQSLFDVRSEGDN